MTKRLLALVLASTFLMLSGCTRATQMIRASSDAEKLTAEMHLAMARGDWQGIYRNGDQELHDNVTERQFGATLVAVQETFGAPVSSKQTHWKADTNDKGTYLSASCETTFEKRAKVNESFKWKKSDSGYKLVQYRINSATAISGTVQ